MECQLHIASRQTAVFYDHESKRACMLDGVSAMLRIARVWLSHKDVVDRLTDDARNMDLSLDPEEFRDRYWSFALIRIFREPEACVPFRDIMRGIIAALQDSRAGPILQANNGVTYKSDRLCAFDLQDVVEAASQDPLKTELAPRMLEAESGWRLLAKSLDSAVLSDSNIEDLVKCPNGGSVPCGLDLLCVPHHVLLEAASDISQECTTSLEIAQGQHIMRKNEAKPHHCSCDNVDTCWSTMCVEVEASNAVVVPGRRSFKEMLEADRFGTSVLKFSTKRTRSGKNSFARLKKVFKYLSCFKQR